jgi:sugar-specific transcriptional regulator TrmB
MKEELKLLGLNDTDIKVYLALLELGKSIASKIAEKSKIPRASIYDVLNRLIKEGLVSYTAKGTNKYFSASDPKAIVESLEYKKNKIKEILPKLEEIKNKETEEKIKTEIYEDVKGIQTLFNLMLKEKEILALGGSGKTTQVMPYFMPNWNRQRKAKKIIVKMIYQDTKENRIRVKQTEKELQPVKYKFLHTDYLSPILTLIFGDKIMFGLFQEEPSATLITNKELAETYKQYFESLWKIAKS